HGGVEQGQDVTPVLFQGGDAFLTETVEVGRVVGDQRGVAARADQVLAEGGGQFGEFGVDGAQPLLLSVVEVGAGLDEVGAVLLQEVALLRIVGGDLLDALPEAPVEEDRVPVAGRAGREFAFDLLDPVRGVGGREGVQGDGLHTLQGLSRAFQRRDGVVEGRGLGVGDDRGDLGQVFGRALFEGGHYVLRADGGEGGEAVGEVAGSPQRVVGHGGLLLAVGRACRSTGFGPRQERYGNVARCIAAATPARAGFGKPTRDRIPRV